MSTVLSQSYLTGLNKGYAQIFADGIAAAGQSKGLLVPKLCFDQSSAGFANMEYDYAAGVVILTEVTDSGMQAMQSLTSKQKTVDNKTFSRLIGLAREKLERRQASVYNRQFMAAGPAFALTLERLLATRMIAGFGAAGFFATSAVKKAPGKSGTFTNTGTKKFSTANFDTALTALQSATDVEGNNLGYGLDPGNLQLIVGPTYRKTAAKCVGAKLVDGGDENVNAGIATLNVWGQLTGANADYWFLIDTSAGKPFVKQDEVPLAMYMQTNPEDSNVMLTGKFLSQLYWRGNIDGIEPQMCYGSTGVDAA